MTDDDLVSLHEDVQAALARGVSKYAVECQIKLKKALCGSLDIDVFDGPMLEAMLDELHRRAWPDATTRPARLVIEQHADPRE